MTPRSVIFSLDNVLHDEQEYLRSGMRSVAAEMSERYRWDPEDTERQLLASLAVSTSGVFERVLMQKGMRTSDMLDLCQQLLDQHWPSIRLANRVKRQLKKLSQRLPLMVLAQGMAGVQQTKLDVLGLASGGLITQTAIVPAHLGAEDLMVELEQLCEHVGCQPEQSTVVCLASDSELIAASTSLKMPRILITESTDTDASSNDENTIQVADIEAALQRLTL